MENYTIDRDVNLFYVQAESFPLGVGGAFKHLYEIIGNDRLRTVYGISFPDGKGSLIYRAAVEEAFKGEGEKHGCEAFTVHSGIYISEYLKDWKKDESIVGRTFRELLKHPHIDKNGYCLEMYPNENDVRCLVPLEN